jgi:hypothetical protein
MKPKIREFYVVSHPYELTDKDRAKIARLCDSDVEFPDFPFMVVSPPGNAGHLDECEM